MAIMTPTRDQLGLKPQIFGRLWQAVAVVGVLALILTGCGEKGSAEGESTANDDAVSENTEASEADGAASAQVFTDAFVREGLVCTPVAEDRLRAGVVEQFTCEGDDYVIMTVRNFEDADERDAQLDRIQGLACEIAESGQEIQRVATSDTWIVMAGGDRDEDFEVFGNAMTSVGLEWNDYVCIV
ncbi:MAG: hypothetical protein ACTIJ6_06910 [Leucobacter sp.]